MQEQDLKKVAERLSHYSEEQLIEELGIRDRAIEADPALAGVADPDIAPQQITAMGPRETLQIIGHRVLKRWNVEAYRVICGSQRGDVTSRGELRHALGLGDVAATAALTSGLLAIPGMPIALAPVIAAIVIKRFGSPALEEVCKYWKENLPEGAEV